MKKTAVFLLIFTMLLQTLSFVGAETVSAGDVDGDGKISAQDARIALRLSVSLDRAAYTVRGYADADGDGSVNAADARLLLRVAVGLEAEDSLAPADLTPPVFSYYPDTQHLQEVRITEGERFAAGGILVRAGDSFSWSSSNPDCVFVDDCGNIEAIKRGCSCVIFKVGEEKFYFLVTVLDEAQRRLDLLREKYPDGYYWNNFEPSEKYPAVTETPCPGHLSGDYSTCIGQCYGFANLISDELFGKNTKKTYGVTAETMRIGDHLRTSHHSVIVTDIIRPGDVCGYNFRTDENIVATSTYVIVVHCNWGYTCNIMWDYDYTDYIYSYDSIIASQSYTRY